MTEPTITQADREAAENALFELRGFRTRIASDKHCLVQAFARHRTASAPAGEVEPVLQWRRIGTGPWWDGSPDHEDRQGSYETRTLYAHPPAPADLVEALRELLSEYVVTKRNGGFEPERIESWGLVIDTRAALAKHGGA